jgi:hypothetical protein
LRQIFENRKNDALNAAMQKSGILKRKCEMFCTTGRGDATAGVVFGSGEAVQNRGTFEPKNKFLSATQNAKVAAEPQERWRLPPKFPCEVCQTWTTTIVAKLGKLAKLIQETTLLCKNCLVENVWNTFCRRFR